jgi:hypothetical protein
MRCSPWVRQSGRVILNVAAAQTVAVAFRRQSIDGPALPTTGATPIAVSRCIGVRA